MVTSSAVARWLAETVGLDVVALGVASVDDAVERRRARLGDREEAYVARLADDPQEQRDLVADVLVHETSFFRYPASFDLLATTLRTRAAARPGPVRVLAVGCATGQEPLSVVMALFEAGVAPERVEVDARDLSAPAVEHARCGRYERGGLRGLAPARLARWFVSDGTAWCVLPAVLERVRFGVSNALDAPDPSSVVPYDAVLCRNLLVYLTPEARVRVFAHLRRVLHDDGLLLVGHAELAAARDAGFEFVDDAGAFACRPPALLPLPSPPCLPPPPSSPMSSAPGTRPAPTPAPARPARGDRVAAVRPHGRAEAASASVARAAEDPVVAAARRAADAGHLDDARARLEELVRAGPPSADAYHLLAVVHRAQGRVRETAEALSRALYLDPAHRDALQLAAMAADERGDRAAADRLRARAAARGRA